jgi:F-type H+-transporting ATPase subunit delta
MIDVALKSSGFSVPIAILQYGAKHDFSGFFVGTSNSLSSAVATRYASALFDLATEAGSVDAVAQDLNRFAALISSNPDLARVIKSPVFGRDEQRLAVEQVLKRAGISGLAANFLRLLAVKRRLTGVQAMIAAYTARVNKARGIVQAEIRVAEKPSPQILDEITASLRDVAKSQIAVSLKIDPALIGGIIVKIGSRMVDASLRNQLNSLRLKMKEAR